jgi:cell division protein FtsB
MSTTGRGRPSRAAPPRGARPAARGGAGRRPSGAARRTPANGTRGARGGRGAAAVAVPEAPRPPARVTSRAAILVLVLAVLAVSWASSMRAYVVQRDHINGLIASNAADQAENERLAREIERHDDPAYQEILARRLGFVMPGEKPFVVLDDGQPLDVESTLTDPATVDPAEPVAWWDDAWGSVLLAGHPPRRTDPPPLTKVTDPEGAPPADGQEDTE